jgi:hypothetical protein
VKWSADSGDVCQYRSEATLVAFYSIQVDHMSQEMGQIEFEIASFRFFIFSAVR